MRILGNIIWFCLAGIWLSAIWLITAILLCITILGIPFGLQLFKLIKLNISPIGKDVEINFSKHPVMNVLWILVVGFGIASLYIFLGIILCITIIGIPFGLQCFKNVPLALMPFGANIK